MNLRPLFRPASIALVGASPRGTPADLLENLARIGFPGEIVLVNPRRSEVAGRPCYPTLSASGKPVDVAAVLVRAAQVPDVLADCVRARAGGAVVFADGFSAADVNGPELQDSLADIANAGGMPVLGPNCMGYLAPAYGTALYIDTVGRMPRSGTIGLVTQSGSVGVAGINHTGTFALSAMISVGNEAVIGLADAIAWLSGDGHTRAIAVFAEGFRDGRAFVAAAVAAKARGVPVVVCKTGRSSGGARSARSHTGSLASDHRVVKAVLEGNGIPVVGDLDELFAAAELLATGRTFTRQVAAVTLSGGHVGLLHDLGAEAGLEFAAPGPAAHTQVERALGARRVVTNPLDSWVNDDVVGAVGRGLAALAASDAGDGFMVAVDAPADPPTSYVEMGRGIARLVADFAARDARPVAMVATAIAADDAAVLDTLAAAGVPRLAGLWPAMAAWSAVARTQGVAAAARAERTDESFPIAARTEPEMYRLLAARGLNVPRHDVCADPDAAVASARRIGFPVVMKIVSATLLHKTEAGGVVMGIASADDAAMAARRLLALPGVDGVLVAETVAPGLDAIVGARIDREFGPVVLLGAGGILAELIDDVAILPAPVLPSAAIAALDGLKLSRLIRGYRSGAPLRPEPLIEVVCRTAELIAGQSAANISIDLNPVRLLPDRVVILDAKIARGGDA